MTRPSSADLFAAALELPPESREEFLRERATDPALEREVRELLDAHVAAGRFLEPPDDELAPGTMLGRYRIVRKLGSGGMGAVYEARREDFEQHVAIKVLRHGAAGREGLRRFETERDVLASLEHPGIARLIDGGTGSDGRPYLVMERVDGLPIDMNCDERHAPVRERLATFLQVCDAVHHAHLSLVVHRDLKPSNVLVQEDGRVKLLDFGIAKVLEDDAPEVTAADRRPMTPRYASPEQVRGDAITLGTDVYGLGLLLYELLVGSSPHAPGSRTRAEIERAVCDETPVRPSLAVRRLEPERAAELARLRSTSPARWRKDLEGELDWIALRALEKEPERRYASARELADDVRRHLAGRPVSAGPPSTAYLLRKLAGRHRWTVTAAALALAALVLGGIATGQAWLRASRAQDEAQRKAAVATAINQHLLRMIGAPDPWSDEPLAPIARDVRVADVLDDAARTVGEDFMDEPEVEASVRTALGRSYRFLGRYDAAIPHLERALELRREHLGDEHPDTLLSRELLAGLWMGMSRQQEALREYEAVLGIRRRTQGERDPATLETLSAVGMALIEAGQQVEAEHRLRESVALCTEALGPEAPQTLRAQRRRAVSLSRLGRYDEGEAILRATLEPHRRVRGERHPDTLGVQTALGTTLLELGRLDESEELLTGTLDACSEVLGDRHPTTLSVRGFVIQLFRLQRRYAEAEAQLRELLELNRAIHGEAHTHTLSTLANLGMVLRDLQRFDEAEEALRAGLAETERLLGADHPKTLVCVHNLGLLMNDMGRFAEAEELFTIAYEGRRAALGATNRMTLNSLNNVASMRRNQGELAGAEEMWLELIELRTEALGAGDPDTLITRHNLAEMLIEDGRANEAEPFVELALDTAVGGPPEHDWLVGVLETDLARCWLATDRAGDAAELLATARERLARALGADHRHTRDAAMLLDRATREAGG